MVTTVQEKNILWDGTFKLQCMSVMCVCVGLCVPSQKPRFLVDWKLVAHVFILYFSLSLSVRIGSGATILT